MAMVSELQKQPTARAPQARQGSCEAVPVSFDALQAANEAGSHDLDATLDRAFDADGLGIICVTGGEDFQATIRRIREDLLPLALQLERLPAQVKESITERGTLNVNNFSSGIDGARSGLYFHPATDTPGDTLPLGINPEPTFYTPNLWPDEALPDLKVQARASAPFLVGVGRELAFAIDRRCCAAFDGYKPGALARLVREPVDCNHKCRLICYHEYAGEDQRAKAKGLWAPPHKDTCLLTALVPGIFLAPDGKRLEKCPDPEVSAPPGSGECLFFQVGEALQIVSGGLYHATEHCVRGPPRALGGYFRASLAVFLQPHAHEDLEAPEGVSFRDIAGRTNDGLFRMFLLYRPQETQKINFLEFCHREGF
eukprot:gnl/TRDRNA2_/TRDRNA2_161473_c0_seq2.p1 gnl/TRDRNA2_/TRDRNA2_161473_c0~~gnl/TRDRNA2_/TRDRNA2_161473_c0_seq2.p1  ORF type:complete len:369 (+),score=62.56 gnl/TRDRNA2_/TRDRNA2_161473_c0_seq2:37-1143(+)